MPVDLVFTDIQMPGLSGMQFVETLQIKPMFIFVTAYEKFALEGYKLDVVDYLLKPVPFDRFIQACNKALERYNNRHLQKAEPAANYIFVNVDYSLVKILFSEVKYVEAHKDYIKIHFNVATKKPLLVRMSMKNIEEMLPSPMFVRIHKSFIINTEHITAIRKSSIFMNEIEFNVSEQYKSIITKLINREV